MVRSIETLATRICPAGLYAAYRAGRAAFETGAPDSANPFAGETRPEWMRGYRLARQRARFADTVRDKKSAAYGSRQGAISQR